VTIANQDMIEKRLDLDVIDVILIYVLNADTYNK
jgi:hypothetical protein